MLTSFIQVSAQQLKFGLNAANMHVNSSAYASSGMLVRPELGFVTSESEISDNLSMHWEFLLSWRGMNYKYYKRIDNYYTTLDYVVDTKYKVKLTYLEVPLILSTDVGPAQLNFGPSLAFQMGGKRVGETVITKDYTTIDDEILTFSEDGNYGNKEIFPKGNKSNRPINFFDLGLNIGLAYPISDGLELNVRYYYGLVDVMQKNYPVQNTSVDRNNHSVIKFSVAVSL